MSLTLVRGTVLGAADFTVFNGVTPPPTPVLLSKETCEDPAYLPMRLKRIALAGLPPAEANAVSKARGVNRPR